MKKIFLSFAIILMIAIAPGSLPFILFRPAMLLLYLLLCVLIWFNNGNNVFKPCLLYLVGLGLLMMITSVSNNSFDSEFVVYIILGYFTYLLLDAIPLDDFKHLFLNVVCTISIVSIIIFSLYTFWGIPLSYYKGGSVDIGHFFFHTLEWHYKPIERNSAFFTEPGCFQYCLNYTLILFFDDIVEGKLKITDKMKLGIVVLALLTCASSVGYFALVTIALAVFYKLKILNFKKLFFILPILAIFVYFIYNSESVSTKFNSDVENESVMSRTADALAMVAMIEDSPLLGNGGSNTKAFLWKARQNGAWGSARGDSNGFLAAIAMLGVLWPFIFIIYSYKGVGRICKNLPPLFLVALLILINSNEFVIFHPIIYLFFFARNKTAKNLSNLFKEAKAKSLVVK